MVSIIVPVYNGAEFIGESLESIFAQTYKEYRIVVIDDGSTDNTHEAVAKFGQSVNYQYQPNAGAGAARNRGVELADDEFIAFLDADDCWTPDKLEKQISILQENSELDAVFGQVRQISQNDWENRYDKLADSSPKLFEGYLPGMMLIRRESFLKVGMFSVIYQVGEGIDWYLRAKEADLKMYLLSEVVLWRRIHDTNSGITRRAFVTDYVKILKQSIDRRRASEQNNSD
jgi:glycosyltransferase involved in cell wall biosynthesis